MKTALIKWLFSHLLPGVLLCIALGLVAHGLFSLGYDNGRSDEKLTGDNALLAERNANATERASLIRANNEALQKAREHEHQQRERAETLAAQLAATENNLRQTSHLLGLGINKAVSDDNKASDCGFNGLGPRGLQLYAGALGYASGGDARASHHP